MYQTNHVRPNSTLTEIFMALCAGQLVHVRF